MFLKYNATISGRNTNINEDIMILNAPITKRKYGPYFTNNWFLV